MANQIVALTLEGLDREHNVPFVEEETVAAPFGLDAYAAVSWVLDVYGDVASSVECLGISFGPFNCGQYEFRIIKGKVQWRIN